MDVLWRIVSLCGIAVWYCLLLAGIKKYRIKDTVKRLSKKEKMAMAAGTALLCLGILMQIARMFLAEGGGIVTGSINWAADWLFARNATAVSLAVVGGGFRAGSAVSDSVSGTDCAKMQDSILPDVLFSDTVCA